MGWPDCYCGTTHGKHGLNGYDDLDDDDDEDNIIVTYLECDYEKNCTRLYKKIENGDFEDVVLFLDSGYWPGEFFRDSQSPAHQARTWITRFEPTDESNNKNTPPEPKWKQDGAATTTTTLMPTQPPQKKIKWSQLPIHLSIVVEAPFAVIKRLVALYPKSVQCTDDELMLPLHLAMRHGASDAVLDLVLRQFPLAVQVRGKHNRTPIDCAFRSTKKARARILATFVEQQQLSRTFDDESLQQAQQQANNDNSNGITMIRSLLSEKEKIIAELQSKLTHLEQSKFRTEMELSHKVSALTTQTLQLESSVEQLQHSKEQMQGDLSKQMDAYQVTKLKDDLEKDKTMKQLELQSVEALSKTRSIEEEQFQSDLKKIESTIEQISSFDGLEIVKIELDRIRSDRFESGRAQALEDMEALNHYCLSLDMMDMVDDKTREKIDSIRKAIDAIKSTEYHVKSNDALALIKQELAELKDELKTKQEISTAKAKLTSLQQSIQAAMKGPLGKKDDKELAIIRSIVEPMKITDLDNKNGEQLTRISAELASLRQRLQNRQLCTELMRELSEIRIGLLEQLEDATPIRMTELETGLVAVDRIYQELVESTTSSSSESTPSTLPPISYLDVKMEINSLKDELKEQEMIDKMNGEIEALKIALEETMRQVDGQKKKDLIVMKAAIDSIGGSNRRSSRQFVELLTIKKDFRDFKLNLIPKSELAKVKEELTLMKSMLAQQMRQRENDAKSNEKLQVILKRLERISSMKIENLKRTEFNDVKLKIVHTWKKMAEIEEVIQAKEELASLKLQLASDLAKAKGNVRKELLVVKHTLDSIDLDAIEIKNQNDWTALKKEFESIKIDLKKKELRALKRILEKEIKNPGSKSVDDIQIIQEASKKINLFALETATNSELTHLKTQVEAQLHKFGNKPSSAGIKGKKKSFFGSLIGAGSRSMKSEDKSNSTRKSKKDQVPTVAAEKPNVLVTTTPIRTLLPPRVQRNNSATTASAATDSSSEDEEESLQEEVEPFLFSFVKGKSNIMDVNDGGIEVIQPSSSIAVAQ